MSKLFYKISNLFSNNLTLFYKITNLFSNNFKLYFFVSLSGFHLCYAIGTKKEKEIFVSKKYTFERNGFTEFMIIDQFGNHYNVNNSFWYWKWDSIEDWSSVKENSKINAKFYGWRIPIFGIFPNIVKTIKITPIYNTEVSNR